jgi:polyether ionophore transport system permease protein
VRPASALAARTFADARVRTGAFAALFALFAYVNVVGYRHTYPTLAERRSFARSFGTNKAVELFYGRPHDLLSVGGYTAWRVGGFAAVVASLWGAHAAVRALRGEEEAGRRELELAAALGRGRAFIAALAGVAACGLVLFSALVVGLVAGRLPVCASAFLALAILSPALVFAAGGAVASQLAPTRRGALQLAFGLAALGFVLRVVADTATSLGSLRWATPLGWAEELRAFADPRPALLVLPALGSGLLAAVAGALAGRRDLGAALVRGRDAAPPHLRLLRSPVGLALRESRGALVAWTLGIGLFALVVGLLSTSFTTENLSPRLRDELRKLGGASLTSPEGALGFYFLFFVLVISLYACASMAAARREEAEGRLETTLALPVGRRGWLAGRLLLGAGGMVALAVTAAVAAWIGSRAENAGVSAARLLEAGANCLPAALLFLALAGLAFATLPRASTGLSYGVVTVAFVWQLVGGLVGAPKALLDLTPFQHVGLVPAQPFRAGAAAAMLGIAFVTTVAALALFERRDLAGA